jgi:hypothetical protein
MGTARVAVLRWVTTGHTFGMRSSVRVEAVFACLGHFTS